MSATYSTFASAVQGETAFTVLAVAKRLLATGKDVIELEIGDSPFPTSPAALEAGVPRRPRRPHALRDRPWACRTSAPPRRRTCSSSTASR